MNRDVTKEELLRLARKAWPGDGVADALPLLGRVLDQADDRLMSINHVRAKPALHVALQQLAGELEPGSATAVVFAYWLLTGFELKHDPKNGWGSHGDGPVPRSAELVDPAPDQARWFGRWLDKHAPGGLTP
jgi:hypothetical protein